MTLTRLNLSFNQLIFFIGTALCAHVFSLIIWFYLEPTPPNFVAYQGAFIGETKQTQRAGAIIGEYPLFGQLPKQIEKQAPVERAKPKVRAAIDKVRVKVRGILSGVTNLAIIEFKGEQLTFSAGETVSYLYIDSIGRDFVVFDNEGILQTVYVSDEEVEIGYDDFDQKNEPEGSSALQKEPAKNLPSFSPRLDPEDREKLQEYRDQLSQNPLQLLGTVNVAPLRRKNALVGYQLTPGSESQLFKKLGLKPGDVVISVNGQSLSKLTDLSQGMALMNNLSRETELDLVVQRRGEERRIIVQLDGG